MAMGYPATYTVTYPALTIGLMRPATRPAPQALPAARPAPQALPATRQVGQMRVPA